MQDNTAKGVCSRCTHRRGSHCTMITLPGIQEVRDQGTGHTTVHHHETEIYDGSYPRQYHFHTQTFHTSRKIPWRPQCFLPHRLSQARDYYCRALHFWRRRWAHRTRGPEEGEACLLCRGGKRLPPTGPLWSSEAGLSTEFCSGFCPAGFYCPWNTSEPLPCAKITTQ